MPPEADPLDRLREQLDRTHDAARKLADEATAAAKSRGSSGSAGAGSDVPPAGWAAPKSDEDEPAEPSELAQLLASLEALRSAIPPELAERLVSVVREFLLALRALVDYALGRLEERRRAEATVEDIPIS